MEPEIIAREDHVGTPADWWAFGVFRYDFFVGHQSFSPLYEMSAQPEYGRAVKKTRKRLRVGDWAGEIWGAEVLILWVAVGGGGYCVYCLPQCTLLVAWATGCCRSLYVALYHQTEDDHGL